MDISAAVETFISKGIFSLFLPFSFANLVFFLKSGQFEIIEMNPADNELLQSTRRWSRFLLEWSERELLIHIHHACVHSFYLR